MSRMIILLSGGLDSCVNLAQAMRRGSVLKALTLDYGQRAAAPEIRSAKTQCRRFGIRHQIISLPWYERIVGSALVNRGRSLPNVKDLDDKRATRQSARRVWAPNRNGLFLAIGAAFAESLGADRVVAGFNAEEAATFPDNSPQFVQAANAMLRYSTLSRVRAVSFTARMTKSELMRLGMRLDAPLDLVWPCYESGADLCGECESCRRFVRAASEAGLADWLAGKRKRVPRILRDERS